MASTANDLVVDAFGLIHAIDINEAAPSPIEMTKALRALSQMIDAWATEGLNIANQTVTGTLDGTTAVITGLSDTSKLAPGMNVAGIGIPSLTRILSIDDVKRQITLDLNTTIAGNGVTLTCTTLPLQSKFEEGVTALLALRLAPLIGEDNIPAIVVKMAQSGWIALQANFMRIPPVSFDPALVFTSMQRTTSAIPSG